jgi:hypothetical protein
MAPLLSRARAVTQGGVGGGGEEPTSIFGFQRPATAPNVFADLVTTEDQAEIIDNSIWTVQNSDAAFSYANDAYTGNGTNALARFVALNTAAQTSGKLLTSVSHLAAVSGGSVSLTPQNATDTDTGGKTAAGRYMDRLTMTSTAALQMRHTVGIGVSAVIESCHVFDLDAMLAKKWFIILVVSQSNWVGAENVLDPTIDTPAYGCVAFPGGNNTSKGWALDGSGFGLPGLVVDPVMHSLLNNGGGPAAAFMKEVRTFVPEDFTPVLVATGYNGAGFAGNGLWSSGSTPKTAYDNFWTQSRHVWGIAPADSVIGGLVFCQGESDLGTGQIADWNSATDGAIALLNEIRAETGWGEMPIVIAEIGGDPIASPNYQQMIDNQVKLATGSGDALEFTRCAYVPRPVDAVLEADQIHFNQATQRTRGYDVARALHDLIYPDAEDSGIFSDEFGDEFE